MIGHQHWRIARTARFVFRRNGSAANALCHRDHLANRRSGGGAEIEGHAFAGSEQMLESEHVGMS
jgi:hypothetical protein